MKWQNKGEWFKTEIELVYIRYWEKNICYEVGEALEQVTQRNGGFSISGSVQGKGGWNFEQPGLVGGYKGWNFMTFMVPFNSNHYTILWNAFLVDFLDYFTKWGSPKLVPEITHSILHNLHFCWLNCIWNHISDANVHSLKNT